MHFLVLIPLTSVVTFVSSPLQQPPSPLHLWFFMFLGLDDPLFLFGWSELEMLNSWSSKYKVHRVYPGLTYRVLMNVIAGAAVGNARRIQFPQARERRRETTHEGMKLTNNQFVLVINKLVTSLSSLKLLLQCRKSFVWFASCV